ncbi:HIT domain-containing protein [candidate division KSB1 bacterium]|nr:HIT domain-containing protein [candidate division KSB1 bacterium]
MEHLWAPWRMEYIRQFETGAGNGCLFCRKSRSKNDRKNLVLYRGGGSFCMMNLFPYNNGHIMVAPYRHTARLDELDDGEYDDLSQLVRLAVRVIEGVFSPHGFNIGLNLGRAAGAGIEHHLHYHIVPRWQGDTNFMPVTGNTKVVSEGLQETWARLKRGFEDINNQDYGS